MVGGCEAVLAGTCGESCSESTALSRSIELISATSPRFTIQSTKSGRPVVNTIGNRGLRRPILPASRTPSTFGMTTSEKTRSTWTPIGWSGGVAIWRRMTSSSVRTDNKIGRRPIDSNRASQQPLIQQRASASKPAYERQQDESQRSNWGAH